MTNVEQDTSGVMQLFIGVVIIGVSDVDTVVGLLEIEEIEAFTTLEGVKVGKEPKSQLTD